jgi:hypothetical protein
VSLLLALQNIPVSLAASSQAQATVFDLFSVKCNLSSFTRSQAEGSLTTPGLSLALRTTGKSQGEGRLSLIGKVGLNAFGEAQSKVTDTFSPKALLNAFGRSQGEGKLTGNFALALRSQTTGQAKATDRLTGIVNTLTAFGESQSKGFIPLTLRFGASSTGQSKGFPTGPTVKATLNAFGKSVGEGKANLQGSIPLAGSGTSTNNSINVMGTSTGPTALTAHFLPFFTTMGNLKTF